jgi:branched-chain amino acid transport system ATP-binding protein
MLLSISNVRVGYGAIIALDQVSLDVERGQIVTLIGSNGAGKTTLLRTISGLLRPREGDISWGEDRVSLNSVKPQDIVRLGISHVPEGRQIFPHLTVRENLMLGAYTRTDRGEISAGLDRCYTLFPILTQRRDQRSGTLSGGEQQMLAIGRALMSRPQLLLLDEPSLGLAPLVVKKIFEIISEINAEGVTIFLVEQNAHMALKTAHRGYVLQTGRVILADDAKRLLENEEVKKAYLGA